jgi:pyruvate-formate lyase-activating enzyme
MTPGPTSQDVGKIYLWDDRLQRLAGHPLEPTMIYAHCLSDLGRPLWVRFVLVPGLTDDYDRRLRQC